MTHFRKLKEDVYRAHNPEGKNTFNRISTTAIFFVVSSGVVFEKRYKNVGYSMLFFESLQLNKMFFRVRKKRTKKKSFYNLLKQTCVGGNVAYF